MSFFRLRENQTHFKQEVIAGLTTFSTMAYIIFVNPAILAEAGMDFQSVMIATCLAGAIGSLLTGLLSNYPFAQAPGMGLNAFFVYTVVFQSGYSWQGALGIVFISGIVFILLTATGLRSAIAHALPSCILHAIPAGIGLFITLIGLNNAQIIDINQGPIIDIILGGSLEHKEVLIDQINQAPPQILQFGDLRSPAVILAVAGFILMSILMIRGLKGAILISIALITILSLMLGVTQWPDNPLILNLDLSPTFFKLNFGELFGSSDTPLFYRLMDLLIILVAFTMVDLFDTLGTLYGTAEKGGFLDKEGKLPRMNKALMADAIATTFGSLLGTSTTTTYIESGTGISAGGRTGLTAVVVAILFLLCIFLSPLAGLIPASATSPALIMVGVLMLGAVKKINFSNLEEAVPAFLVIVLMPFTYSIANGIGAGLVFYTMIKAAKGDFKSLNPVIVIISLLFVLKFILT
ncbi:AGZA family xanthine/uracil permease-like MFS transporter [Catalinimonas alkaloidigena]|uniref:NCS2 family permease n=1 Tax=Catalinimonas alkaloidigena TaxID=1075417 RepID=UPI0024054048|nr:NCS2 family permease [Catalinimonas alkaloidigena]MDF9796666.1 AGZA family xanthine/uracil permease-like MFS transporter [Catalinimonas alkaloidigena]